MIIGHGNILGLGAQLIDSCYEKELLIIGMTEMTDGHSAEKVKEAIELIINNFKFDKAKVKGKNSS